MRIIIAAGGTGGHLYPGIAIAREIKKIDRKVEVLFAVTKKAMDKEIVTREGFQCFSLPSKGLLGKSVKEKAIFPIFLMAGIIVFLGVFLNKKPCVIIGTGGYASFVPLFIGIILGRPTIISEQDSYPGLTTRLLSRFVTEVHIAHIKAKQCLGSTKNVYLTGNPLRDTLFEGTRLDAITYFKLKKGMKTVLILGGSHGARSINKAFVEVIKHHKFPNIQFIFQTGESDYNWVVGSLKGNDEDVKILPFIDKMNLAYSAADLVFSRAGALAIAEISARGLPSVLIPFPYATGGHQEENARYMQKRGASIMMLDKELETDKIVKVLDSLLNNREKLKMMSEKALSVFRKDAAKRIAERALILGGKKRSVS